MSELYLYHATDKRNLDSIMRNGLLCQPPEHNREEAKIIDDTVFLSLDAYAAELCVEEYGGCPKGIAVLKVRLQDLDEYLIDYDRNNLCATINEVSSIAYGGDIPAEILELCDVDYEPYQNIGTFINTDLYEMIKTMFIEPE